MPKLSDSMEEGTILSWLKPEGAHVAEGDELVEIETDKAAMTYDSPGEGVLTHVAREGDTLAVGAVIARIGEAVDAARDELTSPVALLPPPVSGNGTDGADDGIGGGRDVRATPVARRFARAHSVDLATVTGTGPRGRVTRGDVAAAAGITAPPVAPAPAADRLAQAEVAPRDADGVSLRKLTRLQEVVARRMAEANATVPQFQVQTDADMGAALELRARLKEAGGETVPSVNDLVVKAAALALRDHPLANGSYQDGHFRLHEQINVGVAVAAEDALVVPTLTDADARSLGSIAAETRRLAERVRAGVITPAELDGATFTVSNLGMYGMTAIFPVINPPQAAILGVGATRTVDERQLMTLTLTCDHRILYGADAARFLSLVRDLLETPLRLVL